jgi:hypothetical protein
VSLSLSLSLLLAVQSASVSTEKLIIKAGISSVPAVVLGQRAAEAEILQSSSTWICAETSTGSQSHGTQQPSCAHATFLYLGQVLCFEQ